MAELPKIRDEITEAINIADIGGIKNISLHRINFTTSPQQRKLRVKNISFESCLFSHERIHAVIFIGCTFKNCQFNGANIYNCEFHKSVFEDCLFYKAEIEKTYLDPSSFKFRPEWRRKWANVNAWWYQALFQNSKKMFQEDFAMMADKRFLFYRRYEYIFGNRKRPFRFITGLLYDMALGYGYGVVNALSLTCIFIALFAFLMINQTSAAADAGLLESVYFSVVSFTTVGYGEITPRSSILPIFITTAFLFFSFVWGSVVTAVVIKRLVK